MRDCLSESDSPGVFLWLEGRVHGPEGKPTPCFKTQRQNCAEGPCHSGAPIRALALTVQAFTRCYWTAGSGSGDKLSLMSLQLCLGLFVFLSHAGRVPDFHFTSKSQVLSSRAAIKPNFKKKNRRCWISTNLWQRRRNAEILNWLPKCAGMWGVVINKSCFSPSELWLILPDYLHQSADNRNCAAADVAATWLMACGICKATLPLWQVAQFWVIACLSIFFYA